MRVIPVKNGLGTGRLGKNKIRLNVTSGLRKIFLSYSIMGYIIEQQNQREELLVQMLREFNEGRSKSYYCIAATVLEIEELRWALTKARNNSSELQIKEKSKLLHSIINEIAGEKNYLLKLRK